MSNPVISVSGSEISITKIFANYFILLYLQRLSIEFNSKINSQPLPSTKKLIRYD